MKRDYLLQKLSLGNSVAEFDADLANYFLETNTFRRLVEDRVDIVAGDKGSGKSAIYRYINDNAKTLPGLKDIVVLPGFNPSGMPVFQRLAESGALSEGQYISVWKAYLLSLVGNWAISFYEGDSSLPPEVVKLEKILRSWDLRVSVDGPESTFSKIVAWLKRVVNPKSVGIEVKLDALGVPIITPTATYLDPGQEEDTDRESRETLSHQEALTLLDRVVAGLGVTVWVFLDRLDEAFTGYPQIEGPALRALMRAYLDLLALKNVRLKIFIRRDLLSKIMMGGFVNLTHVFARQAEIIWNADDLFSLLCRRIAGNREFVRVAEAEGHSTDTTSLFSAMLPAGVEPNKRQTTWQWMLSKTRDGKGRIQPRNLIDLLIFAQDEQIRREHFSPYHRLFPLITPQAVLNAFDRLSKQRVEDTIIAESTGEVAACIHRLRDSKAEHNNESLAREFCVALSDLKPLVDVLLEMGFLEQKDGIYRIPMLYRKGLNIRMGKAFKSPERGRPSRDGELLSSDNEEA